MVENRKREKMVICCNICGKVVPDGSLYQKDVKGGFIIGHEKCLNDYDKQELYKIKFGDSKKK